jgi:hypothetical protein
MGIKSGRLCLVYQIQDLSINNLVCNNGDIITSDEELYISINKLLEEYKTDKFDKVLKFFKSKDFNVSGICLKSLPVTSLTNRLLNLINLCVGGQNGTDLIHLPFEGTVLEQPNVFIEAYHIFVEEINKWYDLKSKEKPKDETHK